MKSVRSASCWELAHDSSDWALYLVCSKNAQIISHQPTDKQQVALWKSIPCPLWKAPLRFLNSLCTLNTSTECLTGWVQACMEFRFDINGVSRDPPGWIEPVIMALMITPMNWDDDLSWSLRERVVPRSARTMGHEHQTSKNIRPTCSSMGF